jgi:hypothetical protein
MRESTGHDEESEGQKHPAKRYFSATLVNEVGKGDRYAEMGNANHKVGYDVAPHQPSATEIAIDVRYIAGGEKLLSEPGPRSKKYEQD